MKKTAEMHCWELRRNSEGDYYLVGTIKNHQGKNHIDGHSGVLLWIDFINNVAQTANTRWLLMEQRNVDLEFKAFLHKVKSDEELYI